MGIRIAGRDSLMFAAGLLFLTLAKAKSILQGYSSPKPFPIAQIDRSVSYDIKVVDQWLARLSAYAPDHGGVCGRDILELGPGSDLGVGLYLLAKGAATYNACDVNDLTQHAPAAFYSALIDRVRALHPDADIESLRSELAGARAAPGSRLRVVVRRDFDLLSAFGPCSIDLVFSQAAFEHFDDVGRTVEQLGTVCRPGATIVAEIDLKTHSRWIRDQDPNNIYRYPNWLYRAFRFRGSPNRVRPYQYKAAFERHGWTDVSIAPIERPAEWQTCRRPDPQFRESHNQLEYLSIVLCARKG